MTPKKKFANQNDLWLYGIELADTFGYGYHRLEYFSDCAHAPLGGNKGPLIEPMWHHLINPQLVVASLRKAYARFLKIRGKPQEIASGMALGLFIGMTPFMGLHIVTAVFIAALFKWNKISAATGVWITNPLSAPFVYSINYVVGARILGKTGQYRWPTEGGLEAVIDMVSKAPEILWTVSIGGIALGIPLAGVGYYISYSLVQRYQENIRRKIAASKEKLARKKELRRLKHARKSGEASVDVTAGPPERPPEN